MKCRKCDSEIELGSAFCTNCGEKVKKRNVALFCSLTVIIGIVIAIAVFMLCVILNLLLRFTMPTTNAIVFNIIKLVQYILPILIIIFGIPIGILISIIKK